MTGTLSAPGAAGGRRPDPAALFRRAFGRAPDGVFSAPGRVNLIGEHTDYNGGLALPFAIAERSAVAIGRGGRDGVIRVAGAQRPGDGVIEVPVERAWPDGDGYPGWARYLVGIVWALAEDAGRPIEAVDVALDSVVPDGAGLSSSAASECSMALGLSTLFGPRHDNAALAWLTQRSENQFVGVPNGVMDQMASLCCTAGHALLFDTATDTREQVPFDLAGADLVLLVIDTHVKHAHSEGGYRQRREECDRAAEQLGVRWLSELSLADLPAIEARLADPVLAARVRHVVTENARVRAVVAALREHGPAGIGPGLTASHVSLRDDFQVSAPELDLAVDSALAGGALGARMTGGGFGGSAIALVPTRAAGSVADAVRASFVAQGWTVPTIRPAQPSAGAHRDPD